MNDLFEDECKDKEEIKRLSGIVEDMRRAGIVLRNELSDCIDEGKEGRLSLSKLEKAQGAVEEWNGVVNGFDLGWKEDILTVETDCRLKFLD